LKKATQKIGGRPGIAGGFGLGMATKDDRKPINSSRSSSIQARMASVRVGGGCGTIILSVLSG
jgi:hypothetical protein